MTYGVVEGESTLLFFTEACDGLLETPRFAGDQLLVTRFDESEFLHLIRDQLSDTCIPRTRSYV